MQKPVEMGELADIPACMDVGKMSYMGALDAEIFYSTNGVRMNSTFVNVRGIIIPTDWNISGDAIKVSVFTNDEKEYAIENTKRGRELLHFLRQKVMISGQLSERDGKRTIRVDDFSILKDKRGGKKSKWKNRTAADPT